MTTLRLVFLETALEESNEPSPYARVDRLSRRRLIPFNIIGSKFRGPVIPRRIRFGHIREDKAGSQERCFLAFNARQGGIERHPYLWRDCRNRIAVGGIRAQSRRI